MAEGTRPLARICEEEEDMPVRALIYEWCAEDPVLMDIFMRGKRLWCMAQDDENIKIADDQTRDILDGKSDNTAVNRDKLRIGTRQWSMQRFNPNLFGDRVKQELTAGEGVKVNFSIVTQEIPKKDDEQV